MEGAVAGNEIWMGSAAWLEPRGARICAQSQLRQRDDVKPAGAGSSATPELQGSTVHVAINGKYRGAYVLESALRPEADGLIAKLSENYQLALLSGDHEKERARFAGLFGAAAHLRFNQSPLNKLGFIRDLQRDGKTVMMVGDGLNDAGALKQSDVGVAVVENVNAFSPASDVILAAAMVSRIGDVLRYAKQSVGMVRAAFVISSLYNVVGVAIAASGNLSPIVCAILMPLSSATVVAFACGATTWLGRKLKVGEESVERQGASVSQLSTLNPQLTGGAA
jgi:Cu+-exporting ATPase